MDLMPPKILNFLKDTSCYHFPLPKKKSILSPLKMEKTDITKKLGTNSEKLKTQTNYNLITVRP